MSLPSKPVRSQFAAALLVSALAAAAAPAQDCPEPSALDRNPAATPLRVSRDGAELRLSWGSAATEGYAVQAGDLSVLHRDGRYTHATLAATTAEDQIVPLAGGAVYFLVQGVCDGGAGSAGRDASGRERPARGRARLNLGVVEGTGIFGVRMEVREGPGVFADPATMKAEGPFHLGGGALAEGLRLLTTGRPAPDRVGMLAVYTRFRPDMSFTALPGEPRAVFSLEADHWGALPAPGALEVLECEVRNADGAPVEAARCLTAGFTPLP